MSLITKGSYVSANFIDEDRKNIEVLLDLPHTDKKTLTPHVIEADENSKDYKALLKLVTTDQLHEQTWNAKKEESDAFLAIAREVAKDTNIFDEEEAFSKVNLFPTIVDNIFTNMTNEDHLFALKLALFELQEIRESKDTKTKTALRKASNKIEVLKCAFDLTGIRNTFGDTEGEITKDAIEAGFKAQEKKHVEENAPTPPKKKATPKKK